MSIASGIRIVVFGMLLLLFHRNHHVAGHTVLSRSELFSLIQHGALSLAVFPSDLRNQPADVLSVTLPLKFLPKGGCWALKMIVSSDEDDVIYYGVLDTGSPFLTAPASVVDVTRATIYPTTQEQYGESTGDIFWQMAPYLTLLGSIPDPTIIESKNVVLGVVDSPVLLQEAGGIFVGLVAVDDSRPTFLQQIGGGKYKSFVISFDQNYLQLRRGSFIPKNDPDAVQLVDLQPYGPDLHHFAVDCPEFEIVWGNGEKEVVTAASLSRPVVVVLDTGLTGCIFSDSLYHEINSNRNGRKQGTPKGLKVSLTTQRSGMLELRNSRKYWMFSSFCLPWFVDESHHPHIIALGCTFWANCESLAIDTISKRAKIILRESQT
eukprot:scaffold2553_cov138-Cylindrotheca_fusiformis.AAC.19